MALDVVRREKLRVLIVDDDALSRRTVAIHLHRVNVETTEAASGNEGLRLAQKAIESGRPFDLVIVDLFMDGLDGDQVALELRQLKIQPISMLCSSAFDHQEVVACSDDFREIYGFSEVLAKPLRMAQLERALERHFPDRFLPARKSTGWKDLECLRNRLEVPGAIERRTTARIPSPQELASALAEAEVTGHDAVAEARARWKPDTRRLR